MSTNNNVATTTSIQLKDDHPCWGSPTQCDLTHLLSLLSQKESIVYETSQYVVLNKPPDLRMDGPYPATVHKLLTYWYPPPSLGGLLCVLQPDNHQLSSPLLEKIASLSAHNDLSDNELRPCHQLDYATSGLLCIARTQPAAAFAVQQWEDRAVTKEYLALVQGDISQILSGLPVIPEEKAQASLRQQELEYKRSRRKPRKDTYQGFQPPHALFQKFKADQNRETGAAVSQKKRKRPSPLTEEHWQKIWQPVSDYLAKDENKDTAALWQNMEWKKLCTTNMDWKRLFQKVTDIHNDLLRTALQEQDDPSDTVELPTAFTTGSSSDNTNADSESQVFYVSCPLGQPSTEFSMKIAPPASGTTWNEEQFPNANSMVGSKDLDYKPGLTKCTILANNVQWKGQRMSKVLLQPLTGRRHQLRVHMALLGHPIAGDMTYDPNVTVTTRTTNATPARMCLHSHRLSLKLLSKEYDSDGQVVDLIAPDPFPVNRDGTTTLDLVVVGT